MRLGLVEVDLFHDLIVDHNPDQIKEARIQPHQKPEVVKAGSYAYGPAQRPHVGSCVSAEPCLLFIAFEGPVDATPVD